MAKRPESIRVGKVTANPRMSDSSTVTEWSVLDQNGKQIAMVPAEQFAEDGQRMLECWDRGEAYTPTVAVAGQALSPKLAWGKRRELLVDGRDHTLEVDPFVRQLAGIEADADGVFRGALERHQVEQWPGLERELFASLYGASAPVAEVAGADAPADEHLAEREARRVLHALLAGLDDDKRAVFVLAELEQMSAPEIAEATGLKLNTVYSRLRLARAEMDKALERHRARERGGAR